MASSVIADTVWRWSGTIPMLLPSRRADVRAPPRLAVVRAGGGVRGLSERGIAEFWLQGGGSDTISMAAIPHNPFTRPPRSPDESFLPARPAHRPARRARNRRALLYHPHR